ncbi:MAG: ionic transporter y4hA [Cereibacter sphaeroides]|uniref:Ionic transporter y4hA n=1 Tax=Cereibacter sphaeroides TaxID=1063 RepID=A0A2W5SLW0_CERSP|nr:MAG: ionic transporter y4hA [Cereibacter sphaeroides]
MKLPAYDKLPPWASIVPVVAAAALGLHYAGVLPANSTTFFIAAALLLGGAVFSAVHHAEILALKVGEPFGSILLAIAVTIIEVSLIISVLFSNTPGSEVIARDTVYATVMIVLNGVVGMCLVLGAIKHREQSFRIEGASAILSVLGTLAAFTLVLPNFTLAVHGPVYAPKQLLVVGLVSLTLYFVFVFVQTIRHREYFLDASPASEGSRPHQVHTPSSRTAAASLLLLFVALASVVLLAELLSEPLDQLVAASGLPHAVVGVVIATVVLLPEGTAALKAALANRLQSSVNLALGSAVASIGLTIPTVAMVSLFLNQPLVLGLDAEDMTLLIVTLFASILTLGTTGRTTVLQGAVHLVIFAVFLLLSAIP